MLIFLCLFNTLSIAQSSPFSIVDFGAISNVDTHSQALENGVAFAKAIAAANASTSFDTRAVIIPSGVFSFLPATPSFNSLHNLTIFIEGTLNVSTVNVTSNYPGLINGSSPWSPLGFRYCSNLRFLSQTGNGVVNGRGNVWWWLTILTNVARPNLLDVYMCDNLEVGGISFLNAPQYNVFLMEQTNCYVHGVTVMVDIEDQLDVYRYIGAFDDVLDQRNGESKEDAYLRRRLDVTAGPVQRERVGRILRAAGYIGPTNEAQVGVIMSHLMRSKEEKSLIRQGLLPSFLSLESWFNEEWRITPPFPMIYALNTDGIDISGDNLYVRNCSITNFDDTVCPKPRSQGTHNFLIEDILVTYGIGISMGSVPPDAGGNSIDGVLARRAVFYSPLKAFYVKPNPAKPYEATGMINNITYESMIVYDPLWWTVWIGPQQDNIRNDVSFPYSEIDRSKEGGGGLEEKDESKRRLQNGPGNCNFTNLLPGCSFIYPLCNTSCPTDPQVTVSNITLRNIAVYNSLLSPGVIIHNATNPGTGFLFDNVVFHNSSTWPVQDGFWCLNTIGEAIGGTSPVPPCFTSN
jgi:hypothetical protein